VTDGAGDCAAAIEQQAIAVSKTNTVFTDLKNFTPPPKTIFDARLPIHLRGIRRKSAT
jgi:hypothetical protein